MLAAERRQFLLSLLRMEGGVQNEVWIQKLGTYENIIRADLREMETEGLIQRVHGSALPLSVEGMQEAHMIVTGRDTS